MRANLFFVPVHRGKAYFNIRIAPMVRTFLCWLIRWALICVAVLALSWVILVLGVAAWIFLPSREQRPEGFE